MQQSELYDVTIVGGGAAGMFSAFYSGMRDMKTKIIEHKEELGGRLLAYPEKMIWDIGGVAPILGKQLITQLTEQAKTFDPAIVLGQRVVHIEESPLGYFILTTVNGTQHYSKTIILAVGYGVLSYNKLQVENAEQYEKTNLHYTVQELERFRDKHVMISGGGDSAIDWANTLLPIAKKVHVVHRRETFTAMERNIRDLKTSTASLYTPYEISKLNGANNIETVTLRHRDTREERKLPVDAVIVSHGIKSDVGTWKEAGVRMNDYFAVVDSQCATNIPGIYGAGDFVDYDSKVRLIAGAFTDAALAVNNAKLFIEPDAPKTAYVSSHNIRFKERNKQLGLDDDHYNDVRG